MVFEINEDKKYKIELDVVVYGDEHTAVHIAEKKQIEYINAINFTKEQSWKIDFATEYPTMDYFGKVIKTSAQLVPNQSGETLITAKTNGVVNFHNNILEGQKIKPKEPLLSISGKGLANDNAEVRYAEAKNYFEKAYSALLEFNKNAKIFLFLHKTDLVQTKKEQATIAKEVEQIFEIKEKLQAQMYLTSIYDDKIFDVLERIVTKD